MLQELTGGVKEQFLSACLFAAAPTTVTKRTEKSSDTKEWNKISKCSLTTATDESNIMLSVDATKEVFSFYQRFRQKKRGIKIQWKSSKLQLYPAQNSDY